MIFAQFYHDSTGWNGKDFYGPVKLIEACGSDSVAIFDGRFALHTCANEARAICVKRGYKGFTINRGETFNRSTEIRKLELIKNNS